jgi:hypothetical protein
MMNVHDPKEQHTISWTEARTQGLKQYFTGVPCRNGHTSARDVSDRSCYVCKLEKARRWKHANPEKHAAANRKWLGENPADRLAGKRRQRARAPESYWASSALANAKVRADRAGVPLDVDHAFLKELAHHTPVCPVFNITFDYQGRGKLHAASPSLDRIDPKKGYVRGNVAIISFRANAIKQNASWQELEKVAAWLRRQT